MAKQLASKHFDDGSGQRQLGVKRSCLIERPDSGDFPGANIRVLTFGVRKLSAQFSALFAFHNGIASSSSSVAM